MALNKASIVLEEKQEVERKDGHPNKNQEVAPLGGASVVAKVQKKKCNVPHDGCMIDVET